MNTASQQPSVPPASAAPASSPPFGEKARYSLGSAKPRLSEIPNPLVGRSGWESPRIRVWQTPILGSRMRGCTVGFCRSDVEIRDLKHMPKHQQHFQKHDGIEEQTPHFTMLVLKPLAHLYCFIRGPELDVGVASKGIDNTAKCKEASIFQMSAAVGRVIARSGNMLRSSRALFPTLQAHQQCRVSV